MKRLHVDPPAPGEWGMACGAVLSALLLAAAFPPLEWGGLVWVALVPLWLGARFCSLWTALRIGFLGGFLFWVLNLQWLKHVTVLGWLVVCAYCALYFLPTLWIANRWRMNGGFPLAMVFCWIAGELLRSILFCGFPWNLLGVALSPFPVWIQLAETGGVWLVSGAVVFVSSCIVMGAERALLRWTTGTHPRWRVLLAPWVVVGIAILFIYGWGRWRLDVSKEASADAHELHVALAQTAIPQDEKWSSAKVTSIYARLWALSKEAAQHPETELLVWPEAALPDDVLHSETSMMVVEHVLTNGPGYALLAGSLDTRTDDDGHVNYYNAAFLFDAAAEVVGAYAKRVLVIGGEYIPLGRFIPLAWKQRFGIPENISRGTSGSLMRVGRHRIPFSTLICFEDTIPWLAREDVSRGSRVLMNLTNDAWFDPSAARMQHMRNAVLRAVENRVPLVRTANTGISSVILPTGEIQTMADFPPDEPHLLTAAVPVPKRAGGTMYSRIGDTIPWTSLFLCAAWVACHFISQKRHRPPTA